VTGVLLKKTADRPGVLDDLEHGSTNVDLGVYLRRAMAYDGGENNGHQ